MTHTPRSDSNAAVDASCERLDAGLRRFVAAHVPQGEVDDLVQDVLLRWFAREPGNTVENPEAWLITTARNRITDFMRARGRSQDGLTGDRPADGGARLDLSQGPTPQIAPELTPRLAVESPPAGALSDLVRCLDQMLDELDQTDRALLRNVDLEGRSQADLAKELGLSLSGARTRVQRARARLRARFDACCEFEVDARGNVLSYRQRGANCGEGCPPSAQGQSAADTASS